MNEVHPTPEEEELINIQEGDIFVPREGDPVTHPRARKVISITLRKQEGNCRTMITYKWPHDESAGQQITTRGKFLKVTPFLVQT